MGRPTRRVDDHKVAIREAGCRIGSDDRDLIAARRGDGVGEWLTEPLAPTVVDRDLSPARALADAERTADEDPAGRTGRDHETAGGVARRPLDVVGRQGEPGLEGAVEPLEAHAARSPDKDEEAQWRECGRLIPARRRRK
jgi:hypothetical protein